MSVTTVAPNIDLHLENKDVHIVSPISVSYQPVVSSNFSSSQATFSCPPPSKEIFIDRCVYLALPFTAIVTVASNAIPSPYKLFGNNIALRAYPEASIINSTQVTIENQSYSLQASDLIPPMGHFWPQTHDSTYPDFTDTYSQYIDAVGTNNNPLSGYQNCVDKVMTRGAFPMAISQSTNNLSFAVQSVILEPCWSPIFSRTFDSGLGLSNVQTLNVVVNFNTNLGRILSYVPLTGVGAVTNISIRYDLGIPGSGAGEPAFADIDPALGQITSLNVQGPTLLFKYSTPPPSYVPTMLEYRADRIDYWMTNTRTATGAVTPAYPAKEVTAQNIQLGCIPDSLLLFVRESAGVIALQAGGGIGSADTVANITNVNIHLII